MLNLKEIISDPRRACEMRWPDDTHEADKNFIAVNALIEAIASIKPAIKAHKIAKQECARDFGRIKALGGDLTLQKEQMQRVTSEMTALEQKQQTLEAELLDLFAHAPTTVRSFPARFDEYSRASPAATNVALVNRDTQALWDDYVANHPQASFYHLYQWRAVVEASFGHTCFYLAAKNAEGQLCGVLPLIRLRSSLFGNFAISVPFFNYGGPLADNNEIAQQLLDAAIAIAQERQLDHLEIRATHIINQWPVRSDKVSMIRRLPITVDELDNEIGAKVRAQIKRARQESVEICIGHLNLLDDFYRVFATNMRDLGTPVYGKNFFRNILESFIEQSHIVIVRLHGKPVATAFLLGYRDMMEIPWASTLRSANALNMNMLLYRVVLEFTIERRYQFFDFGRSTVDSGTFRFKRQWGAQPLQHYWHYWLPSNGELPALKPDSPKFRLLVAAWQKLPVLISNLIGPHIVKYLP